MKKGIFRFCVAAVFVLALTSDCRSGGRMATTSFTRPVQAIKKTVEAFKADLPASPLSLLIQL